MAEQTIVAIGGGGFGGEPYDSRLDDYLLSQVDASRPRIAFLPQASAENKDYTVKFYQAFSHRAAATWISLFNRTVQDLRSELLSQDLIFVGGGNTANMLAIWRVHGVDAILREAWETGVVLCGVSAGAICWFDSSVTDSFGRQLDALQDGLSLLPGSFCPHYDGEERRRPVYRRLIADRVLPAGYAADNGVAVKFSGTEFVEAVTTHTSAKAWRLQPDEADGFTETGIPSRLLEPA